MIEVIPGILEKNFEAMQQKIDLVKSHVKSIHIDVLDNTLFHNVTYNYWPAYKALTLANFYEAHLMVADPSSYVAPLVENGFRRLIAHAEAESIRDFVTQARAHEVEVGLAFDAGSELELIEPYLEEIDTVLIMTVNAGFSGQTFQPAQLTKIKRIHEEYPNLPISVDGGINKTTAPEAIASGATRLTVTSYLFKENPDQIEKAIQELSR
ncbi:MAG: Ribulose-phosphate 3-epimerase [Candidatus Gottesmanbacteria bacterium GW2011_GWA1_43_11]|uniref:Ribulose-phosphate 3-epimerase n=1 Tax=Candidatus Gottesmanbacteria bacterium GW2011_GWA1_43_11 TaxID=1618436 RepID=A0A0G1FEE1_9BACT|nr:MAG: Ribulose-phosphate 3-epimerase [Candidatus Gottesmanbacteria bacterium GW2011_GWA1_43_11]